MADEIVAQDVDTTVETVVPASVEANNKPTRYVDPETGTLQILASTDDLTKLVPQMDFGALAVWARMPIFRVKLYFSREKWQNGEQPYVDRVFSEGEDAHSAIQWWQKRLSRENKGFGVFEGGFDASGPVTLTEPPFIAIDASGEVEADSAEDIERKRLMYIKRKEVAQRWETKGVSPDLQSKIEAAELLAKERKQRGQTFMMKGGWVNPKDCKFDLKRHNEIQKQFG